jgi:hypothetical protein
MKRDWKKIVDEVAERYGAAVSVLRRPADPAGYPREANASRFLAQALDGGPAAGDALVECEYWWRYIRNTNRNRYRSIADIWKPEGDAPELFAEVKLAGLWRRSKRNIGEKTAPTTLHLWADDIWYLLTLANRHEGAPVEKAFVVVALGDCVVDLTDIDVAPMLSRDAGDAGTMHDYLLKPPHGNNVQAVKQFFTRLAERTGARVLTSETITSPVEGGDPLEVRCIAAVWCDTKPWDSSRYTFEAWSEREGWIGRGS